MEACNFTVFSWCISAKQPTEEDVRLSNCMASERLMHLFGPCSPEQVLIATRPFRSNNGSCQLKSLGISNVCGSAMTSEKHSKAVPCQWFMSVATELMEVLRSSLQKQQ